MTSCVSAGDLYQSKSSVGIACSEAIKLNWLSVCSTFNSPLHLTPPVKWPLYVLLWRWRTTHSLTHSPSSFIHWFTWFIHSLTHSLTRLLHSFIDSLDSFIHSLTHSLAFFIHSLIHLIHSFTHSLTHSLTHSPSSFIHWFTWFTHSPTHSLTHPLTNLLHSPHSLYLPHPTAQFSNLHQLSSSMTLTVDKNRHETSQGHTHVCDPYLWCVRPKTIPAQNVVQTAASGMAQGRLRTPCDRQRHDNSSDTCTSDSGVGRPPGTDEEVHQPLRYASPNTHIHRQPQYIARMTSVRAHSHNDSPKATTYCMRQWFCPGWRVTHWNTSPGHLICKASRKSPKSGQNLDPCHYLVRAL